MFHKKIQNNNNNNNNKKKFKAITIAKLVAKVITMKKLNMKNNKKNIELKKKDKVPMNHNIIKMILMKIKVAKRKPMGIQQAIMAALIKKVILLLTTMLSERKENRQK